MNKENSINLNSAIRDNRSRGNIGDFLCEKIKDNSKLSFVSAYFTIYAYDKLRDELDNIESLDFLFGEPRFITSLDPDKNISKSFGIEDFNLELKERLEQKIIARECSEWIRNKVKIKTIRNFDFLHGKMYYIDNNGVDDAIIGSSNFTVRGLGLNEQSNIELNLEVNDKRDREDLKKWFYEIWNNDEIVEDVKQKVLDYLEQLYIDTPPEFIYYKTLYHIFEQYLQEDDQKTKIDEKVRVIDSEIWKILFDFQKDGAKGAINKLLKYNGCILADSVGLGKTYTALAVIKYFELLNYRVLVLCPKRLRDNWTVYQAANNSQLNPLLKDKFSYSVLSHTDLSREEGYAGDINLGTFNWSNFDLVVIDESHNFRNNTPGKTDDYGNLIRKSRYQRLIDDIISSGVKTKVLLLSATPVNNQLKDLRNQISLMTSGDFNAFGDLLDIKDYAELFRVAQLQFTTWAKKDIRLVSELLHTLDSAFFKLLDALSIARSRKHIKRYYDLLKIGHFPERAKPLPIYPNIDLEDMFMSYDKLNDEISAYQLSLFNPTKYLKKEYKDLYDGKIKQFKQSLREDYLIGMMKVNFMKRLESSVNSFSISLGRTIDKIKELEKKIKEYQDNNKDPELDFDQTKIDDPDDEDLQEANQVGKKIKFQLAHLNLDNWLKDLKKDKQQLNNLFTSAKDITTERDAKLDELKKLIKHKILNPSTNLEGKPVKKVLVFTAFADTATYLYRNLENFVKKDLNTHIALVTGGSSPNYTTLGEKDFNKILTNFAPLAKNRKQLSGFPQDEEIDILIATDCISEGQNLQDCDYLINYDIHWNPVRIIQRFGRIDRIGSRNQKIFMVNFWPTKDLDKYIRLKNRVEARMALVDLTATAEENILNDDELKDLIDKDLKYRDRQLLRLKDEVLDLEDLDENLSLSDFSLDDFRMELLRYIEKNKEKLDDAPLGLYSIVPTSSEYLTIKPGVIFCLKQKGNFADNEAVNPVQPYFLVYLQDDGELRANFVQTKQILEIYQHLCSGKENVYDELCQLFNSETDQGRNMQLYNELLRKAVLAIASTFRKRMVARLQIDRGGLLLPQSQQPSYEKDFDLITWLIIK